MSIVIMSLHRKTLLIIGFTLLTLIVILYISLRTILLHSFNQLEQNQTERNVERVLNTIANDYAHLSSQAGDYAFWDDTYLFIQQRIPEYTEQVTADALANLNINLMLWINLQGEVVYQKMIDLETGADLLLPASLEPYLQPGGALWQSSSSTGDSTITGLIMTEHGPLMVASQPILTNDKRGPAQGTLIFGRLMSAAYVQKLSEASRLAVTLSAMNTAQLPDDFRQATPTLAGGQAVVAQPLSEDLIGGYTLLADMENQPALMLRVEAPREIYAQGQSSLVYFLLALVVIGLVFMIVTLRLLDRTVLIRLANLSERIIAIRSQADLSQRVVMSGSDELSSLAQNMNGMLEALSRSQADLKIANQELENRVQQRTAELSQTNARLKQEIIQHQETQEELAQARDEALEALRLKAQILASVSHDSRTPLNVIMLRTEMLLTERYGPVNDKQKDTLNSILSNSRQLLSFINNLLNEAQMQSGKLKLKSVVFAPAQLIQEVAHSMQPLTESKGLQLQTEIAPNLPVQIKTDPIRLSQVITNLMENAIKFTDQGQIIIRAAGAEGGCWRLQIADTGVGISPEAQGRIFEAFWQVKGNAPRQANQGIGLGLSIVRQLVNLMGGDIRVDSQVGQGSTFTVTLPLAAPVDSKEIALPAG